MNEILKRKAWRFKVMYELYKTVGDNVRKWGDLSQLTSHFGLTQSDFQAIYLYLIDAGLIAQFGSGYNSSITHAGIKAVEAAVLYPHKETEYFPAVDSIELNTGEIKKL